MLRGKEGVKGWAGAMNKPAGLCDFRKAQRDWGNRSITTCRNLIPNGVSEGPWRTEVSSGLKWPSSCWPHKEASRVWAMLAVLGGHQPHISPADTKTLMNITRSSILARLALWCVCVPLRFIYWLPDHHQHMEAGPWDMTRSWGQSPMRRISLCKRDPRDLASCFYLQDQISSTNTKQTMNWEGDPRQTQDLLMLRSWISHPSAL